MITFVNQSLHFSRTVALALRTKFVALAGFEDCGLGLVFKG